MSIRGAVEKGDLVKVQPTIDQPEMDGQVVARSRDGDVVVSIHQGTDRITVNESKVWKDEYRLREVYDDDVA